ncbi:hypothetical protein BDZ97DRAFT_1811582 [Flammula alnicola]|nr:hypothetical protein BDZ97DRAFT_1811582 [Flammula alnicola]
MAHKDPHVQREESQHIAPQQSRPNLPAFSNSATVSVGHVVWDGKQEHMGPVQWEAQQFPGLRTPVLRHFAALSTLQASRMLPAPTYIYIGEASHAKCAHTPPNHCLTPTWAHAKINAIPTGDPDGAIYASLLIRFGLECSEYRIIAQDGGLYR